MVNVEMLGFAGSAPTYSPTYRVVNAAGYESQFGIALQVQKPLEIGGGIHALMAESVKNDTVMPTDIVLAESMQALLTEAKNTLGFNEGEYTMFISDIPNTPPTMPTVVMVAQANSSQQTATQREQILGICQLVKLIDGTGNEGLDPVITANGYFNTPDAKIDSGTAVITVLQQPKHGRLEPNSISDWTLVNYLSNDGYRGNDSFILQVEGNGHTVKLHYFIAITDDMGVKKNPNPVCTGEQGRSYWKISLDANGNSIWTAVDYQSSFTDTAALASTLGSSILSGLIGNASGVSLNMADLPAGALGQTTGSTITLDANAAGYNWFIDYTPWLNEEYLPTADANVWQARPGSDAAGKMDMLSVLLHEYGHVLGIEHSADRHAAMAATLQPGTRRLPSADELALMAQLVSEVKTGLTHTPESPSVPTLPLGTTLGGLWLARLRKGGAGDTALPNVTPANTDPSATPHYAVAAHPTLTNPAFTGGAGWSTAGTVTFDSGAATLSESATAQTRLNQLFVLGAQDRFLRFTLADIALDDVNGAPDDAFEVALIDANTGLSLLGSTGLTRSDALLNLQANGSERLAPTVTSTRNVDGSRTYLVDLSSVVGAAGFTGAVASLSFDLIGFGRGASATTSHLTVRDLKLGIPQTFDDTITTAEDTPTVINALANDLDATQPGFVPVLVSGPAHGTVSINADGSFGYTPTANYFGSDSFTYKLADNRVDSNIATVNPSTCY